MAKLIDQNLQILVTDPDSASFENPLGPRDVVGLREQVDQSDPTGALKACTSRPMVPRRGYPVRQG